jgi:hypothetical protein
MKVSGQIHTLVALIPQKDLSSEGWVDLRDSLHVIMERKILSSK